MILPTNGSVVVIDDKFKQALPVIQALSKKGISSTYYSGVESDKLPESPVQNVRLAIVDLQLLSSDNDGHQIATRMVQILRQIISPDNGPYVLLIWSLKQIHFGQALKDEVNKIENEIVPACIVELDKSRCIQQKTEKARMNDYINNVINDLEKKDLVDSDDLESLKYILEEEWIIDDDADFEIKPDAIEVIEQNIEDKLKNAGVFHLFVIWENLLKKSAAQTITNVASVVESNKYWEQNMQTLFYRLGKARVGQNEVNMSDSLLTFMQSYNDIVESEIQSMIYPEYIKLESKDKFIITENGSEYKLGIEQGGEAIFKDGNRIFFKGNDREKLVKAIKDHTIDAEKQAALKLLQSHDKIPPKLNTGLHLELKPSKIHIPGNIYEIVLEDEKKQAYLSSTYYKTKRENLSDFTFIELEISPICDYAQTKWKKSRLVSGLIYPSNQDIRSNIGHFYYVEPEFLLNGKVCKMVFDCHLFKSLDHDEVKNRTIKYRLKRELLLDIIAKVSSHVNRPGISFVS